MWQIERRENGDETWFAIVDLPEAYLGVSRDLFFEPLADGVGRRFPTRSHNLDAAYAGFERHVEDLLRQQAGERPVPWDAALDAVLSRLANQSIDWLLVGSAALAVRGLDVQPGDVDLVVDESGAYALGDLLSDALIEPVRPTPGWIGASFGRAFLGAAVEWVGAVDPSVDVPVVTDFGPVAASRSELVRWRGHDVRVPPLDLMLAVNERRGRLDRADLIRGAMSPAVPQERT